MIDPVFAVIVVAGAGVFAWGCWDEARAALARRRRWRAEERGDG